MKYNIYKTKNSVVKDDDYYIIRDENDKIVSYGDTPKEAKDKLLNKIKTVKEHPDKYIESFEIG